MSHVSHLASVSTVSAPATIPVVIDYHHVPEEMVAAEAAMALPLLPVGRVTLIEKQIAWLRQCGFRKILINLRTGHRDTRLFLQRRKVQGVSVSVVPERNANDLPRLLSEEEPATGQGVLLMSGLFLGSFFLPSIYHHSTLFSAGRETKPLCYIAPRTLLAQVASMAPGVSTEAIVKRLSRQNQGIRNLRLSDPSFTLKSLADYRELNRYTNFVEGKDILIGAHSKIAKDCTFMGPNLIGEGVVIEEGCTIGPYATLADGVHVGRNSVVRDAIVTHNTQVPAGSLHEHCLVLPDLALNTRLPTWSHKTKLPSITRIRPKQPPARQAVGRFRHLKSAWTFLGLQFQFFSEQVEVIGLFPTPLGRSQPARGKRS
ncbi:nucleotidyltransferase family protein [Acanthopleuribacter pedis]|uniref:NDP-sugar synthase n=1 Tax=Acanthopleuribacter pedis TaxID=442870 RepID=A0A8J7U279_9BACT|nr:NDP-sugar synthase [Acanthopleuribacter pedis]MBO1317429.1 NDP-sugar synthase [Acanthopleuribacter pedis]